MQVIHWKGQLSDKHFQYNYVYIFLHSLPVVDKESELITGVTHYEFKIIQALHTVDNPKTVQ